MDENEIFSSRFVSRLELSDPILFRLTSNYERNQI